MKSNAGVIHAVLIVAVLLLGLYLRGIAVGETRVDNPLRADAGDYVAYALNLTKYGTYSRSHDAYRKENSTPPKPDAVRAPGYPALIAGVMLTIPERAQRTVVLWLQAVLSTLTILICWILFRDVLSAGGALLVALLTALSPHLVVMNVYYLSETLYTFLLVLAVWLTTKIDTRPLSALAPGFVFGLSALTRPASQYFVFIYAAFIAWTRRGKRGLLLAMVLISAFMVVTAPWALRNLATSGHISNQSLVIGTIAHGMYPGFRYRDRPETFGIPYRFDPKSESYSRSLSALFKELYQRAAKEPARYALWYLQKPLWLWRWDSVQGAGDIYIYPVYNSPYEKRPLFGVSRSFMKTTHVPILLLALAGCVLPWLRISASRYTEHQVFILRGISGLLFYFTLIHMIGAPFPRYGTPLRPFIYGMAVLAMEWLVIGYVKQRADLKAEN